MEFKVKEIKGIKSLRAYNAFSMLMLGLKMLPKHQLREYEEFFEEIQNMSEADQRLMLTQAATFVEINQTELEALIMYCTDKNGVALTYENAKNLTPADLVAVVVAVGLEMLKIKIDSITDSQKKN